MSTNSNQIVTLNTQDDWEVWRDQLEALARSKRIWEIVTGEAIEDSEPVNPESTANKPPASSTRSSTTPPGTSSLDQALRERQFKWSIYQHELKEFDKQQKALADTKAWILNTVKPRLQSNNCSPADSIAKWFENLKKSVGISDFLIREKAIQEYKQAIKTPRIRDIHTWLADWEMAMQRGTRWQIAQVATPQDGFNDFLNAVAPLHPTWVESYSIAQQEAVENKSISYRKVSQDFRSRLGTALSRPKVAKGSFGPTFAEADVREELEGDESEKDPDTATTRKRKRGSANKASDRAITGPRSRRMSPRNDRAITGPGSRRMSPCKACLQPHDWRKCFYLFPSLASVWFKPNKDIEVFVIHLLETNQEFADQVKQERARQEAEK
jgi:hypothetical protein